MSDGRFAGKVALVTGATSGIGQACAVAFAEAGARVACVGRKEDALREVAARINGFDTEALTLSADFSSSGEGERVVNETVKTFGGIDVLVNAAGHLSSGTIENTTLEAWDDMMNVNVRAAFQLMQKVRRV